MKALAEVHHRRLFFVLVPALVLLDQATKLWIRVGLPLDASGRPLTPVGVASRLPHRITVIPGFFDIVHVKNRGAAWGLMGGNDHRMLFFFVVTVAAFALILSYYRKLKPSDRLLAFSLSMIFAGAAGNFIDRMAFSEVTDFLDFYATGWAAPIARKIIGSSHWPAFNVADICIVVGVGFFAWHSLFIEGKEGADSGEAPPGSESTNDSGVETVPSGGAPTP